MFQLLNALKAGQELKDPVLWKNRQATMNAVGIIVACAISGLRMAGYDLGLSDEAQTLLVEVIAGGLGFVNLILVPATSKKVGL